nr:probable disease resistance protein At4g33300 [Quercus suber]
MLLHHSASLQHESSNIPVEAINKIVRGCGGFPLALEVIGRLLNENPVEAWRSIAENWSNSHYIFNSCFITQHLCNMRIVRGCGGFPLALEVIGRLLNENPVEAWRSIAENWSNSHYIFNSNSDLLDCLRKSLEISDHEVIFKECFMDLGSFPEDQRIPVAALTDMLAELHKLDEVGNNAIYNLHKIATWNLANLVRKRKDAGEINKYYNEDYVTQHDLLRELAIFESCQGPERQRQRLIMDISGNTLPSWCTEQDQQPINARLLSISTAYLSLWIKWISDCLSIRHLPKEIGELCKLGEIHMKGCLSLRNELPPSTTNLEQLKLVICDEERAKFWEPIKEVLTNLEVKVAEKVINLTCLLKP